jgi:hypothetical protein
VIPLRPIPGDRAYTVSMRKPYALLSLALVLTSFGSAVAEEKNSGKGNESTRAVVKSKSNITNNREAAPADSNGNSGDRAAGAVVKSKSNITNNREAAPADSSNGSSGQNKQK